MDKTGAALLSECVTSETFSGVQTTHSTPERLTGHLWPKAQRNGTRKGQPIERKAARGHSKSGDQWMDIEPDYRQRPDYKRAKQLVKERVNNVKIVSYGGLGRYLADIDPAYPQHLDSILDDLIAEREVNYNKHDAMPSKVRSACKV